CDWSLVWGRWRLRGSCLACARGLIRNWCFACSRRLVCTSRLGPGGLLLRNGELARNNQRRARGFLFFARPCLGAVPALRCLCDRIVVWRCLDDRILVWRCLDDCRLGPLFAREFPGPRYIVDRAHVVTFADVGATTTVVGCCVVWI